jgi:serine/threonine-protein kinase
MTMAPADAGGGDEREDEELVIGEPDPVPAPPQRPRPPRRPKKPVARNVPVDAGVAEPGFYSVDSKPYATIYVDDKSYGATPLFKVPLPPGKHRVRAVRADGKSQRLSITIQPGKLFSSGTLSW